MPPCRLAVLAAHDEHARSQLAFEMGGQPADEPAVVHVRREVEPQQGEPLVRRVGRADELAPHLVVADEGERVGPHHRRVAGSRRFAERVRLFVRADRRRGEDAGEAGVRLRWALVAEVHGGGDLG